MEIERARLTKTLAHIKEQSGDVKEAASILQELQVRLIFTFTCVALFTVTQITNIQYTQTIENVK